MKRGLAILLGVSMGAQLMASVSFARDRESYRDCRDMEHKVVKGAVLGGILGAVLGNNTGDRHVDAGEVAAGAVLGGVAGAAIEDARCRNDDGAVIIYRDYPGRPGYDRRPMPPPPGRPYPPPPPPDRYDRYERVVSPYDFNREFMDYYVRLQDSYTQSREIRNYADRLARRGEKIDGRMLYDVLSRIYERGPGATGIERLRGLQDLQFVTARLSPRERYDVSTLFDRRDRSSFDAERILSRM